MRSKRSPKSNSRAGAVESCSALSADAITSKAEGAAEAFGLSASQFQTSAALIGSMLKNQMGLSAEEAADRVEDLTGKAADMAATFGGTTSDAISGYRLAAAWGTGSDRKVWRVHVRCVHPGLRPRERAGRFH